MKDKRKSIKTLPFLGSMLNHNNHVFIIFGPTGVGKSDFVEKLASTMPKKTAIINLDMGSFYTPLTIGTAKPNWHASKTPHYLFDIIQEPRHVTVAEYRNLLVGTLEQLWAQDIVPIVVGGSSFYVKNIFFPPVRHRGQKASLADHRSAPLKTNAELWQELYCIDPDRAAVIHPHDRYRIERALILWQETGQKPSLFAPSYSPPGNYTLLFLTRDRLDLHERINKRVQAMIADGWVQEVESMIDTLWEHFLVEKKIIGYDDLLQYIRGAIEIEKAIEIIQQKTRAYAKRQHTFWRMLERQLCHAQQTNPAVDAQITSVNLTSIDIDLYISQLSKYDN